MRMPGKEMAMAHRMDPETLRDRMQLVSQRYREVSLQLTETSTQFVRQCLATRRCVARLRATLDWYSEQTPANAMLRPFGTLENADRFPQIEQALEDVLRPVREQCRQGL